MKLTIHERIVLLSILPAEGNFLTLKLVRQLREALSFTEQELADYCFMQSETGITWDNEKADPEGRAIEIGEKMTDLIVVTLKQLDEANKLTNEHFTLYEKFVNA